jgi:hypothetical protein
MDISKKFTDSFKEQVTRIRIKGDKQETLHVINSFMESDTAYFEVKPKKNMTIRRILFMDNKNLLAERKLKKNEYINVTKEDIMHIGLNLTVETKYLK